MALLEDIAAADAPDLMSVLGTDGVTQYPRGDSASARTTPAIWDPEKAETDRLAGRENVRTGELQVPASLVVSKEDVWLINGDQFTTTELGGVDVGWRLLKLKVRDPGVRSAKGRVTI